ncbi:MAG TPA: IPT/TIG domain-containing protein, partial [Pseudomonas sp.]|nr:IPT/TIG domain-containing protein [Pseudomonas sp.]
VEEPGRISIDLQDDVQTQSLFTFTLPGVIDPDIYDLFLRIPSGALTREIKVGSLSYTLPKGLGVVLPNYPPMQIGAAQAVEDLLFIGVKAGAQPTASNRFLMPAGLEIYDIGLWERPIRLSQLRLDNPVLGLEVLDKVVYLANDRAGVSVVDINDFNRPLLVAGLKLPNHRALDLAVEQERRVLAVAAANDLGSGYVRFLPLGRNELGAQAPLPSIAFDGSLRPDLHGAPVDLQWLNGELYVLFLRNQQLHLATFKNFGEQLDYRVQAIERGAVAGSVSEALSKPTLQVQQGLISVATGERYLLLEANAQGQYETIYWQNQVNSGELLAMGGQVMQGNGKGVEINSQPYLAVASSTPGTGAVIGLNEPVRIAFNNLINSDAAHLAQAVRVLDAQGQPLDGAAYEMAGSNTLRGGQIELRFKGDYQGRLRIEIGQTLNDLQGHALRQPFVLQLERRTGVRPQVDQVQREVEGVAGLHYFHANGSEQALIRGSGFGIAPEQLAVWIGETRLQPEQLLSVSDKELRITVPDLQLGGISATLSLKVERLDQNLAYLRQGAMTVLPQIEIDDLQPKTGPPQGGNLVTLHGRGFNHYMSVRFAGALAGDIKVLSSNRIELRAPAGSFGKAPVIVTSQLFPGEQSQAPVEYFYTGVPTGSVNLPSEVASPIAAITRLEGAESQLLYVITGGSFDKLDQQGRVARITSRDARLIVADISDPVHPVIVTKKFLDQDKYYHYEATNGLAPRGFVDMTIAERQLFVAGGRRLVQFDLTLPAEPERISELELPAEINALASGDGLIYVAYQQGIRLYRLTAELKLIDLGLLDTARLGGVPGRLRLAGSSLWLTLPQQRQLVEIELASGEYRIQRRVNTRDLSGNPFVPEDLLVLPEQLLVSSGGNATVQLFALDSDSSASPVADLKLAYLVSRGDLFAGQLQLAGQTLYVAGGQGDVQLFDISPWLAGQVRTTIALRDYFSVLGNVTSLSLGSQALYAGSSFVFVDGQPAENPLANLSDGTQLGGSLNTLAYQNLAILSQSPRPGARLARDAAIEVQFNRLLDNQQLRDQGSQLVQLLLDGVAVPSQVAQVGVGRLVLRPNALTPGKQYEVLLGAALRDQQKRSLGHDYRFRFIADGETQIQLEGLSPRQSSWRGGAEATVRGRGFGENLIIEVGGRRVAASDILYRDESEVRLRIPGLAASPANNLLVGLRLRQGGQEAFQAAALTYVADPQLDKSGTYNRLTGVLSAGAKQLIFNAGETIGLQGRGFGEATQVRVNGRLLADVRLERADLLSFVAPQDTLGTLQIEVSNQGFVSDTARDASLRIELPAQRQLDNTKLFSRQGELLLTASLRDVQLFSLRDGSKPQLLARLQSAADLRDIALGDGYAALLDNNAQLQVYDLGNLYAPRKLAVLPNSRKINYQSLELAGDLLLLRSQERVFHGQIQGAELQELSLEHTAGLVDMALDSRAIYLLFNDRLDVRSARDPAQLLSRHSHGLGAGTRLWLDGSRVYLHGGGTLQLLQRAALLRGRGEPLLGELSLPAGQVAVQGELLALSVGNELQVFDLDSDGQQGLVRRLLARIVPGVTVSQLELHGNLLEWRGNDSYYNAELPMNNTWALAPATLAAADEPLGLRLSGPDYAWLPATAGLSELAGTAIDAQSQAQGTELRVIPRQPVFEPAGLYRLRVEQQPLNWLQGAEVNVDLPWLVDGADFFGAAQVRLDALQPNRSLAGQLRSFVLRGRQLNLVDELQIGERVLGREQLQVNPEGDQLSFSLQLDEARLYAVQARFGQQRVLLPTALAVTAPLVIDDVISAYPGGGKVSDSGGTAVQLKAQGLSEGLSLHWFPAGQGVQPSSANRIDFTLSDAGLNFVTPPSQAGWNYQLSLLRDSSGERVDSLPAHWLAVVDDTPPKVRVISTLGALQPLVLEGDTPLSLDGFSVIKQFKDYDSHAQPSEDISARFIAPVGQGKRLELRLRADASLEPNALYTVRLNGIRDAAGNQAIGDISIQGGNYVGGYLADDRLPPRADSLSLLLEASGQPLTAATQLKSGNRYSLLASAQDNMQAADKLSFAYRLSADGGKTYRTDWIAIQKGAFSIDLAGEYQGLSLLLRASDGRNSSERRFDAQVSAPTLRLRQFSTLPTPVEESTTSQLRFELEGDLDQVRSTEVRLQDGRYAAASLDPQTGLVSLAQAHSRLSELPGSPQAPYPLTAELRIGVGQAGLLGYQYFQGRYDLVADRTPPQLSIIAPLDGEFVPRGETTEVVLRSYDRYGIDRVEACVDSQTPDPFADAQACQRLADPSRLRVPVAADASQPLRIVARALDLNGLISSTASVTLQPYDSRVGAPELTILAPTDGLVVQAGEPLAVRVRLRQLEQARLYLDIGGDPQHPNNPAPRVLDRALDDDEYLELELTAPQVASDGVLVLRMEASWQSQTLRTQRILNLRADQGIDETPSLSLQPAQTLLAGTQLWLDAPAPATMQDFSSSSRLELFDPSDAAAPVPLAFSAARQVWSSRPEGSALRLEAILRDRSGHEKTASHSLAKLAYLQGESRRDSIEKGYEAALLTALAGHPQALAWSENRSSDGYRLNTLDGLLESRDSGRVQQLFFSGSALVAQIRREGDDFLRVWRWQDNAWQPAQEQATAGRLVGASGNLLFVRHGQQISGFAFDQQGFAELVGLSLDDEIRQVQVDGQRLAVLTRAGLELLQLDDGALPALRRTASLALADRLGFALEGNRLISWSASAVEGHNLSADAQGLHLGAAQTLPVVGRVGEARFDGELSWLRVSEDLHGDSWQVWRGSERLGALGGAYQSLAFAAGQLFYLQRGDEQQLVVEALQVAEPP